MAKDATYKTIKVKSWKEYINLIDTDFSSSDWIFRGQGDANWPLETTLERSGAGPSEPTMILNYKRASRIFIPQEEIPEKDNTLEWLSLMQHYGVPTRYLDFTASPFVAAFFAYENLTDKDVAIWVIDHETLTNTFIDDLKKDYSDSDLEADYYGITNRDLTENKINKIIPVLIENFNRRSFFQQSIFLSSGNAIEPFMELLENTKVKVVKIVLPYKDQLHAMYNLNRMTINRATLFPDIEGYSKYISTVHNPVHSLYDFFLSEDETGKIKFKRMINETYKAKTTKKSGK